MLKRVSLATKKVTEPVLVGTATERAKQFLTYLRKNHTALAKLLPLQLEVNKVVQDLYPTVPNKVINMALYYHTSCLGYTENIVRGYGRFTIDEVFVEDISDEDRETALTLLKKVKSKLFKQALRMKQDNCGNTFQPTKQQSSNGLKVSYKPRRNY